MASAKPQEIVFKRVDGLDITMDVYVPESATPESPAPVVLWWHGECSSLSVLIVY